jgi:MFS family permease
MSPRLLDRLGKAAIVAPPGFNRWRVPPASIAIHLCIGSVYAWSLFNAPLTRLRGVVAPAADDWALGSVVWIFSVAIVFLGLAAAFGGKWLERVGPRMVGVVSALLWAGGFFVGSAGIFTQQLWLLYLGYGVLGGCGLGLGYVSPVSTLIRWFPDRRGMATGMAIMGFGGGAMIAAPMKQWLLALFARAPERLGHLGDLELLSEAGRRFAMVGGARTEVVVGPEGGVFVVGSGSTGAGETFLLLGALYLVVMLVAAFSYRVPPDGWRPEGWAPSKGGTRRLVTDRNVHVDQALLTPQFYLLWLVLCLNVTAGIGVLGVAKTMITEIFGTTLPSIVDASFAATYVLMISAFNMAGRFLWASASDVLGRQRTYTVFFVLGIALYLSIPLSAQQVSASPSVAWLVLFYAATMVIFTMYGGGFATIPAYLADLFGTRFVGGIHGRLLTAWSTAGILGPLLITTLRSRSVNAAIRDVAATVDPARFEATFGAPVDQLDALVAANTVRLSNLMPLAPEGTVDPSATVYDTPCWRWRGCSSSRSSRISPCDPCTRGTTCPSRVPAPDRG